MTENGTRSSRDVLVGYRVSNRLTAKVRDLDEVSTVIDEVITAGGDSIRFRDLTFTVEDVSPLLGQLREDAVSDAKTKAQHFADISRVTLGRLLYMAEPGAGQRGGDVFVRSQSYALEAAAAAPPTGISGGELAGDAEHPGGVRDLVDLRQGDRGRLLGWPLTFDAGRRLG